MYIEFIGTPGAGKTTIVEKTREILEKEGIYCVTRANFFDPKRKRMSKLLWSFLHLPRLDFQALKLFLLLSRYRKSGFEKTITKIHEYHKLCHQLSNHKDKRVILWDGGLIQQFSGLIQEGLIDKESMIDFIEKRLPRKTLLVSIDTPVLEAERRMSEREPNTVLGDKKKELMEIQNTQKSVMYELSARGMPLVVLDGMKSVEDNALILHQIVKEKMS